jgi:hypothetical protein
MLRRNSISARASPQEPNKRRGRLKGTQGNSVSSCELNNGLKGVFARNPRGGLGESDSLERPHRDVRLDRSGAGCEASLRASGPPMSSEGRSPNTARPTKKRTYDRSQRKADRPT